MQNVVSVWPDFRRGTILFSHVHRRWFAFLQTKQVLSDEESSVDVYTSIPIINKAKKNFFFVPYWKWFYKIVETFSKTINSMRKKTFFDPNWKTQLKICENVETFFQTIILMRTILRKNVCFNSGFFVQTLLLYCGVEDTFISAFFVANDRKKTASSSFEKKPSFNANVISFSCYIAFDVVGKDCLPSPYCTGPSAGISNAETLPIKCMHYLWKPARGFHQVQKKMLSTLKY